MSQVSPQAREFANRLAELAPDPRSPRDSGNRAALAALRRGLGKSLGEDFEAYRYVGRILVASRRQDEEARYLVATLFALHPVSWTDDPAAPRRTNLGASFRVLASQTEAERADSRSIERRFVALLNCHADDLATHLRHAVSLLKSQNVPIDWAQLLEDVRGWSRWGERIRSEWARAYWGAAEIADGATPDTPSGDEQDNGDNRNVN